MILLDIIVSEFLPSWIGWVFLVFVVVSERMLLSKFLTKAWKDRKIYKTVLISNIITTIVGFFIIGEKRDLGHFVNWIPVDYYHDNLRTDRTISFFISAFVLTIVLETIYNVWALRKEYNIWRVAVGTLLVNIFTYIVAAIIFYAYNFL